MTAGGMMQSVWPKEVGVDTVALEDVPSRCDVCGVWTHSPHEPHDPGCDRSGDCDCDHVTCAGCCWHCEGVTA